MVAQFDPCGGVSKYWYAWGCAMRLRLAGVVCLCLALSLPLLAQKFTGTIRGVVTDNSGAVLVNAQVSITSKATGDVRNVTTNQSGEYVALELNPGTYSVTVKHPGFREFVSSGVVLNVSSVTVVNAQLSRGLLGKR